VELEEFSRVLPASDLTLPDFCQLDYARLFVLVSMYTMYIVVVVLISLSKTLVRFPRCIAAYILLVHMFWQGCHHCPGSGRWYVLGACL